MMVSAIVPAYNEEKSVGKALDALVHCAYIDEVILVNDGSTDKTLSEARKISGISIVDLPQNRGKGFAVATGIRQAKGEIILLVDADVLNLSESMIEKLILPLQKRAVDGIIAYPDNIIDKIFIPFVGERGYYKKDLLPHLKHFEKKGYGLELYLNYIFAERKIAIVRLENFRKPMKHKKQSYDIAARLLLTEILQVMHEITSQSNPTQYFNKAFLKPFRKVNGVSNDFNAKTLLKRLKDKVI